MSKTAGELIVPCCHTCKYVGNVNPPFLAEPLPDVMAWCRRRAPVLMADGRTSWPRTTEETWCGEYEMNKDFQPTSGWQT